MKYCEEYAALLDLFVDGELSPEDMARVGDHLAECPGCRTYVDDALAIRACFPSVEETFVPEGFAGGVMERIRKKSARDKKLVERRRREVRRWLGTAAALAACCAVVVLARTGNDAAAPAGGNAAYGAVISGEEAEIAPQAAPESEETSKEEALEKEAQVTPTARSKMAEPYNAEPALRAAPAEDMDLAAAAPEAVMNDVQKDNSTAALYLTEEEAGDLLDGFPVVWENAVEWRYELNVEEYRALLEALGRPEEMPEAAAGPFLVVVTGPKE